MLDPARILDDLNPPQREAVQHPEGPLLILAGAGSGKTRVITHRIAWLVGALGVDPRELVAMTFTNKAAGEMRERAERQLGAELAGAYVGTFHAYGLRILRANAVAAGYPPGFVIYDTADQLALVRAAMKDRGIDPKALAPRQVLSWISRLKNDLVSPEEARENARHGSARQVAELYEDYSSRLVRAGAVDFDDLLVQVIRLFRTRPEIAERYARRTRFLLVDEYQDTNAMQYALIRILAGHHRNVCTVGDEDQSIYAFRGADIQNILNFTRDYPDARIIKLEQNYRSTRTILDAASAVIRNNTERHDKTLWTDGPEGDAIRVHEAPDDRAEADWIVGDMLQRARRDGLALERVGVLYRTNATSRLLEDRLMAHNVPYRVVGSLRFYERKEIKDLLAWLRLLVHPDSDQDFLRAASTPPRGLGAKTLEQLAARAATAGSSLHEAARAALRDPANVSGRALRALEGFLGTLSDLGDMTREISTAATLESVIHAIGYFDYLEKNHPTDHASRAENVGALMTAAHEHDETGAIGGLGGFLDRVSLRSDTDDVQGARGPSLMTIHSAKGLEFDVVYVVGLNEELFPHPFALGEQDGMEEERRLMYVALTRARQVLSLTCARVRGQFGRVVPVRPSRFLEEVPGHLVASTRAAAPGLDWIGASGARTARPGPAPRPTPAAGLGRRAGELSYEPDDAAGGGAPWRRGMKVVHPNFGHGVVINTEGSGRYLKLKIRFEGGRLRKLVAAQATLTPE